MTTTAEASSGPQVGTEAALDPVTFEVIRHRLWAINDDQARMAARLSASPVVYDGFDFNAALVTADGRGLVTGVYIMHHGAALDDFVRKLLADWPADDLHEGDMFYTNDPWWGALHANDGIMASPLFYDGQLVAWTGIVMHDDDVGGPVPSSFVLGATDRFGEAPLFPALRIVENWELKRDIERARLRNSRTPQVNALNMRARIAALRATQERMKELIDRYGLPAFLASQDGIIDYVERVVRGRLREIPDGTWFAQGYLDHDGTNDEVYRICCRVTKRDDNLVIDFEGTSPEAQGPVNCARPAMEGAVVGCLLLALCYDLPWSVGALRRIVEIRAEEGSINNAASTAAVSLSSIQGTLCTQDVTASAIAKMLLSSERFRSEAQATWAAGHPGAAMAATGRDGEYAVGAITDTFAGGGGARTFADGVDSGGIYHSMGSRLANAETCEDRRPFLQLYRTELCDSGGAGRYRGGVCVAFGSVPHKERGDVTVLTLSSGVEMPGGMGLAGGAPGAAVSNVVVRDSDIWSRLGAGHLPRTEEEVVGGTVQALAAKDLTTIGHADVVTGVTNAGSGYGDPLHRDPAAVARDVREGHVSAWSAHENYGVVLTDGAVDETATERRRAAVREERLAEARPVDGTTSTGRGVVTDAEVLHPVADAVEAVRAVGGARIRCTECHLDLGAYEEDYKQSLVFRERPLTSLTALNKRCRTDVFVAREFYCPGCGVLLVTDVTHRDEPVRAECRFFPTRASDVTDPEDVTA
ncbi:hydantoinase B/oxoprolinase family protein [Streptomyces sp. NPDC005492]|uniref:hydantoinase B/oxoprolinase family protein n=1 Tax=Streptomyces sp. NPDC005492 TaxID=3156883 RepID=UPI0033B6A0DD